jgi:hypothetical protein
MQGAAMVDRRDYRESPVRPWEHKRGGAGASVGQPFTHRGAFTTGATYAAMDIAMVNGSAFIAPRDNPGSCPGPGWRLLAAVGKRGPKGNPSPTISSWDVDARSFTVTPLMSDSTRGPRLELLGLFREFLQRIGWDRVMSDRCEKCEQVAAELRAEFDLLRQDFVRRIEVILDKTGEAIDDVEARNLGLIADIDRRMQRLFDRFSERLRLPPQRIDEEPPRPH